MYTVTAILQAWQKTQLSACVRTYEYYRFDRIVDAFVVIVPVRLTTDTKIVKSSAPNFRTIPIRVIIRRRTTTAVRAKDTIVTLVNSDPTALLSARVWSSILSNWY